VLINNNTVKQQEKINNNTVKQQSKSIETIKNENYGSNA
jgi:hypothetical protein